MVLRAARCQESEDFGHIAPPLTEAIHNFVEVLNEFFHNVCELDLVFNFYKVTSDSHMIIVT